MSFLDSDSSDDVGMYKNFRQISRQRLLHEMLRFTKKEDTESTWKVLITDNVTLKIMSCAFKIADLTQEGVSLVEHICRKRQPMPFLSAIYFIQPTKENVVMFLSDMDGMSRLYKRAFVFFSSPISEDLLTLIKKNRHVVPGIVALKEMNLEYFAIDSQGFVTDNMTALEELFGEEEDFCKGDASLNVMATRIATVFASLKEFPSIRYRAAKFLDAATVTPFHDLIPTKLAARVWDRLIHYKRKLKNFPQTETCEMLILDRSVDQIAPVIHEWTYDAMCHDLLNLDGNKYVHEIPSKKGGPPEIKEVILDEHDPVWLELRHAHIADASERLHEKVASFVSKNKAAHIQHVSRNGEPSFRDLQEMVQALPEYGQQMHKLSLHVEIAVKINRIIMELGLRDIGQLEQDLVFGDAGMKDVINFLTKKEDASRENKLRLLMILAAVYPEKFDSKEDLDLMKLSRLSQCDIDAVKNMRLLGCPESKKSSAGPFSLKFDIHKRAVRKDRAGAEETSWQLSRFYPMIEELIEKLNKGELSKDEYPCLNDPSETSHWTHQTVSTNHSVTSRRTPTWARPRNSNDRDSGLRHASIDFKKMGRRIFVFIAGGATRSELSVCHKLTKKLQREVVLGSSSLDDSSEFITKLKLLKAHELSLDDLQLSNVVGMTGGQ
ncbi:SNARE-interacting protein KEULE isoform X2 [Ricinus communis]|uniref:SNARE-interacting protein KEULE isoform X2 n=1 Tax=Ricinus communis TaxID=3988 RepID=UPI000D68B9A8|nr:SNARE-interacting protein KEULE isoform X2 [Ricinus communis]|eukprot:XP_025015454.1 SNARE-interacting protein KEULE isoform X2 [Ricinus communis]